MIKLLSLTCIMILAAGLMSCSSSEKNNDEISLKADRKILDQYRQEIPEDVKAENDFMALVLKDMAEVKTSPQTVRDHYYREVRRKRDSFNKQHRQIREKFNKDEKKKREEFLKDLKKERDKFVSSKPKSDESREFFNDQNVKRNEFFHDASDRRKEFESQMDTYRRDFNDDMQLKQKQFDDAYREYYKNYQEKEKQKKLEMSMPSGASKSTVTTSMPTNEQPATYPGQDKDLQEFDNLKSSKRQTLESGGN